MLEATDPSIRFEVLERFSDLADCEDDVRSMIHLLENDADPCVRHEAAAQLFRIEEKKPHLMNSLRQRAIAALLDKAWNDESTVVRHESIEVLGYIGDEDCLKSLTKLAMDENVDIRSTAEIALRTTEHRIERGITASALCTNLVDRWRAGERPA